MKPVKGDAVLFFSLSPDGIPDPRSLHASCPVLEGEKWSAPKWIRVRSFDSEDTSPHETHVPVESSTKSYPESSIDAKQCTSESENCEELIASGDEPQIGTTSMVQKDEVQEE